MDFRQSYRKKRSARRGENTVIQFDSCSAFINSLSRYLKKKDFRGVGVAEGLPEWTGKVINLLPRVARKTLFSWSGWLEAIPGRDIRELREKDISQWAIGLYPRKKYDAIFFGSANGGVLHISAALKAPWLPQTYLVALRRLLHPDEIQKDIEWGQKAIAPFLENNTGMHATQMHDPVQDRVMIQKMGYFRLKKLGLDDIFRNFISEHTVKGAPIITVECKFPWPALKLSDRHFFQVGGLGALTPREYLHGGDRVKAFLKRVGSKSDKWDTFSPSGEYPEGEWGFFGDCLEEISDFAEKTGHPLWRLIFEHPEDISPFTAELYAWWYKKHSIESGRLIVENFGLVVPYDVIETRSIPFWLAFNTDPSNEKIRKYLENGRSFREIYLMLMSNALAEGIGLTPVTEWEKILNKAGSKGKFLGVDKKEYPLDLATFVKYYYEVKNTIRDRYPFPEKLSFKDLIAFTEKNGGSYGVKLERVR
jgi:hypothetical protein